MYNIDEIKAYRVAYGKSLGSKDYAKYIVIPGLILATLSLLILYNGWVSGVMFIMGCIYGWRVILPRSIRREYERKAFNQRNKFLNNITQVLTDDSQTVLMALDKVIPRASGEFKEDLKTFYAILIGANNNQIRDAVMWICDKYDDDVVFIQYMEQLETAMIEGKNNVDTLKDIKTYHNDIRKKQEQFEQGKAAHFRDMKQLAFITVILLVALALSFGFSTYLEAFARHPVGYVTGGIYIFAILFFLRQFVGYFFDDSVMEVD